MTEYLDRYPTMHEYAEGKRINPKMTDLISRADAIDACCRGWNNTAEDCIRNIKELPSAELPKGDLISRADAIEAACNEMDWLDDGCVEERKTMIKDALSELPSADAVDVNDVTIHYKPYPSAEAEPKWNCTANFVAEQLDRLRNMTDEERWDFLKRFFSPSADAVPIHEDGTLEINVPNAQKVGRVLVKDVDSHIGGGLFYPDDAEQGEWIFNPTDAIDLMFAKPKCSKCGFESSDGGNFCPNCGARMKGGDDE